MTGATAATDCCNGQLQQLRETRYTTKETRHMTGATAATDCCNGLLQQLQQLRETRTDATCGTLYARLTRGLVSAMTEV